MFTVFEKQPKEKKEHILRICVEEFAKNGFDNTSTDTITERAGISKGLLFHYFKSKKNLYLYVFDYITNKWTEMLLPALSDLSDTEFFEHIRKLTLQKMNMMFEYKDEATFIIRTLYQPPAALKDEIQTSIATFITNFQQSDMPYKLYREELIDETRLRPGVTKQTVIKMTRILMESYANELLVQNDYTQVRFIDDPEAMTNEIDDFIRVLKHGVYKDA